MGLACTQTQFIRRQESDLVWLNDLDPVCGARGLFDRILHRGVAPCALVLGVHLVAFDELPFAASDERTRVHSQFLVGFGDQNLDFPILEDRLDVRSVPGSFVLSLLWGKARFYFIEAFRHVCIRTTGVYTWQEDPFFSSRGSGTAVAVGVGAGNVTGGYATAETGAAGAGYVAAATGAAGAGYVAAATGAGYVAAATGTGWGFGTATLKAMPGAIPAGT